MTNGRRSFLKGVLGAGATVAGSALPAAASREKRESSR